MAEKKKASKKKKAGKGLTKPELEKYRKLLLELRAKIAGDLKHLEEDTLKKNQRDSSGDLSGYSFHMADVATDNFDVETNLGLASNEQNTLNLIDSAIRRINDRTYGLCELCEKNIPQKRLVAMPYATNCVKCQEQAERENNLR